MSPRPGRPVLFLAHAYPPENVIGALRPFRFVKYLPRFGYSPHILTGSLQTAGAHNIHYVPTRTTLAERIFNRVLQFHENLSWASAAADAAEALARQEQIRIVFSTSPPMSVHLAARRLHRRLGIPWVADFRDPMGGNDARLSPAIRAVDRIFEPKFFHDASIIISNTDAAAEFVKARYPEYRDKVRTIYNGFDPEDDALWALPIPPRAERVLSHIGSLYRVSMHHALLDAMSRAVRQGQISGVRLRLIGLIEDYPTLQVLPAFRYLQSAGVLDCTPQMLPLAEARRSMAESDALVAVDRYRKGGIIQLPAKTFEYIQVGRPILAVTGPGSPMEYALRTSGVRHVCLYPEHDPPEIMVGKIVEFLQFSSEPVAVSDAYRNEFGALGQTQRLAGFFDAVLSDVS